MYFWVMVLNNVNMHLVLGPSGGISTLLLATVLAMFVDGLMTRVAYILRCILDS